MKSLPTELWNHIFALACQDGGVTGRALSATSKFTRAASSHSRYTSLAIHSTQQLGTFYNSVQQVSDSPPLHVVRLYIYINSEHVSESMLHLVQPLSSLLTLAAPNLRCLTLCFRHSLLWHTLPGFLPLLPALEDLVALWDPPGTPRPHTQRVHDLPTMQQPRLRRLHIATPNPLKFQFRDFPSVPRPRLACWRVSMNDAQGFTDARLEEMHDGMKRAEWEERYARHIARLPPDSTDLFELYVFSPEGARTPDGRNRMEEAWQTGFEMAKRAVGQVPDAFRAHFLQGHYSVQNAYEDWLDVVTGGNGCWGQKVLK